MRSWGQCTGGGREGCEAEAEGRAWTGDQRLDASRAAVLATLTPDSLMLLALVADASLTGAHALSPRVTHPVSSRTPPLSPQRQRMRYVHTPDHSTRGRTHTWAMGPCTQVKTHARAAET